MRTNYGIPRSSMSRAGLLLLIGATAYHSGAQRETTRPNSRRSERPPVRSGAGLAFDSHRSRLVLFGGSDSAFHPLGDTWEWASGEWRQRLIAGPDARSDFAMTYDSRRGRIVVFGGQTATALSRETWEFDGQSWTRVATGGPQARNLASMAFDAARGRVVLFGGASGHVSLGDTWEWDGTVWRRGLVDSVHGPAARGSHTLVFDGDDERVVLIGGYINDAVADCWEWDGARWTRVADGPKVLHHAAAYDPRTHAILVFGGFNARFARTADLFKRVAGTWQSVTAESPPPPRAEHRGAFVPGVGFVIFGGIGGQGMSLEERGRAKLNDLWAFDGTRWQELR